MHEHLAQRVRRVVDVDRASPRAWSFVLRFVERGDDRIAERAVASIRSCRPTAASSRPEMGALLEERAGRGRMQGRFRDGRERRGDDHYTSICDRIRARLLAAVGAATRHVQRSMYSTCSVCNQSLGANEADRALSGRRTTGVRRAKGRLWVVCHHCGRWNLSPLEERWEAIEECERLFRGTLVRVSTDNIGLARLADGLELIRIGAPLRPEFAAWRYGRHFGKTASPDAVDRRSGSRRGRDRRHRARPDDRAGARDSARISIVAVPGLTTVMGVVPMVGMLAARDYIQHDRVVARLAQRPASRHGPREAPRQRRAETSRGGTTAARHSPSTHDTGWTEFTDTAAIHATGVLIAGANRFGAPPRARQDAVRADRARRRRERLPVRRVGAQRAGAADASCRS